MSKKIEEYKEHLNTIGYAHLRTRKEVREAFRGIEEVIKIIEEIVQEHKDSDMKIIFANRVYDILVEKGLI